MGVSEAFNVPAIANAGASYTFQLAPGGTGVMLAALEDKSVDIAFALTESVVAAIEKGSPVRILCPYVTSPLLWAHCVRPGYGADLSRAVWGVSRLGSGSHTMACVLWKERGYSGAPRFEVCGDFGGLRAALADGRIDAFLWERYTTAPFVGEELAIVGGTPTPWGCFSAVVNPEEFDARFDADCARGVMGDVLLRCRDFQDSQSRETIASIERLSGMNERDACAWHAGVRYAGSGQSVSLEELELARDTVLNAGVIDRVTFADPAGYCV